jgi:hypothetical protein
MWCTQIEIEFMNEKIMVISDRVTLMKFLIRVSFSIKMVVFHPSDWAEY